MARKPRNTVPKQVEPEDLSQEVPEEEPVVQLVKEPLEQPGEKPMNKSQAARAAIDAGHDKPGPAVEYIKSQFGIEMSQPHFSAVKSGYKKANAAAAAKAKPAKRGRPPGSKAVEGYLAPAPKPRPIVAADELLAAMEAVKPLIASLGAEKVKRLVDVLG